MHVLLSANDSKNVQNSARFRTTLEFDRKYFPNGSRYNAESCNVVHSKLNDVTLWGAIKFTVRPKQ